MGLAPLEPGDPRRAGLYALRARLGSGGMGQVFLADGPRGERVAVKLLHPHIASDAQARARLARELRTLSRVRGPHLAEVLDADVDAPRPFIVTRYVPGPTLDERVAADGPLDPAALLATAKGLATALAAVHRAGVVHRDLKPGNVVCGPDGPTLLDFGIASAVDEAVLTRTGEVWGTPAYLAPEQVVTGRAEPASDLHALGATLVYAATGAPLYGTGRADAVMYRVVHDTPALPPLPGPLGPLLPRLLDTDPARRPSAAAVLDVLAHPAGDRTRVLGAALPPAGSAGPGGTRLLPPPTRAVTPPAPAQRTAAGAAHPLPAPGDPWAPSPGAEDPWSRSPGPVPPRPVPPGPVPPVAGPLPPGADQPVAAQRPLAAAAGPWAGRVVGLLVVLALAAAALLAPLLVPLVTYAVVLPLHDALGRTHAAAAERRQRRGPRATDGLRSAVGLTGYLLRALLGAALRLPLLLVPGAAAAGAGLLAALAAGADGTTALRWSSAALTAALAAWLLSPRRQRHAAAARTDLRHRAGAQGTAAGALVAGLLAVALLAAAPGGAATWAPLAERPSLPGWAADLLSLP